MVRVDRYRERLTGEEKQWTDWVAEDRWVFGHHGGLEHRRTKPLGLVQHSMRKGL